MLIESISGYLVPLGVLVLSLAVLLFSAERLVAASEDVGVALGRVFLRDPQRVTIVASQAAMVGLAAFVALRLLGLGDVHQPTQGVIGWLSVTKYPPGEAFLTLMLGLDFALLAALSKWPSRWLAPLEVYGRVPFFF